MAEPIETDTVPPGLERLADLLWETAVKLELRKRAAKMASEVAS